MIEFEIDLPNEQSLIIDVTNKDFYNYDFNSYSLLQLQRAASLSVTDKIKNELFSHVSEVSLINKLANNGEDEYVAKLSDDVKKKLKSGEWSLGIRKKTGETYAVLKDTVSGKSKSFVTLEKKVVKKLGSLPELSAIQGQLAAIAKQIENLNHLVQRVEQGQYNDRYAGFFSARQQVIEGLATTDYMLKKELLISAVKTNNDTIAKLMCSLYQDIHEFIDVKTKKKDAQRIGDLLQTSIGYLNSSVQLNLVAYTVMGEQQSLIATLKNYQAFIDQTLLRSIGYNDKSIAWLIDNMQKGNSGRFLDLSVSVSNKITKLIDTTYE